MANKFQNISLTNEEDAAGIEKAGNNLLLGIGNVLDAASMTEEEEEKIRQEEEETGQKANVNATKVCYFVAVMYKF